MAQITIEVSERGIKEAERELKKLGQTGDKTDKTSIGLGTTYKDLDKTMKASLKPISAVASAITAVGAATIGTTVAIAAQVVEMDNLSRVSEQGINDYKNGAFAATQYGITVDQLGNAFKDTGERVGEFITSGSGGLQDFGDAMGLSKDETVAFANEVKNLSGKDILLRMVSDLESVGKSSKEISFALEGMGSDLTYIIPLLSNGGAELDRLSASMASVTVPLTDDDVSKFRELNEAVQLTTGAMKSLLTSAVLPLVDPITDLAEATAFFFASLNEGSEAQLSSTLVDLRDRSKELTIAIEDSETAWGRLSNVASFESTDTEYLQQQLAEVNKQIDETTKKLNDIRFSPESDSSESSKTAADTAKELQDILDRQNREAIEKKEQAEQAARDRKVAADEKAITDEQARNQAAIDSQVESLSDRYQTEFDLLNERLSLVNQSSIAEQEKLALSSQLWGEYFDNQIEKSSETAKAVAESAKAAADAELAQNKRALDGWDSMTQDLKSTLGEQNALFKTSATVNATIKTYEAANSAYAAMASIPYVGPALGAAAAGVAIASGIANVQAINSARMQGGQVNAGQAYNVGERGMETFVPDTNGRIVPSHQAGGGSGQSVNVIVNNNAPNTKASASTDENGDIYVKIEELDELVGSILSNPNSEGFGGLNSLAPQQR